MKNVFQFQLVYLVTLRCNLKCIMCSNNRTSDKNKEISYDVFINAVKNFKNISNLQIGISGGEPFLKDDIFELIKALTELGVHCGITTNGTCLDKIEYLLKKIKNKDKLNFAVSIDGIGEVYHKIRGVNCFAQALSCLYMLKKYNVNFQVNTVIQKENMSHLHYMQEYWKCLGIHQAMIPKLCGGAIKFDYGEEDCQVIFPYLNNPIDKKYIASYGKFNIRQCHAAEGKACTIDPYGNVYACYIGSLKNPEKFMMGNIIDNSLDNILCSASEVVKTNVHTCEGCYAGCEISREAIFYNIDYSLDINDLANMSQYIHNISYLDKNTIDESSWHGMEYTKEGSFRWMSRKNSRIFLKALSNEKEIHLKIMNALPENNLDVYINNTHVYSTKLPGGNSELSIPFVFYGGGGYNSICIIELRVDKIFKPSEIFQSTDSRELGIALFYAKLL